MEEVLTKEKNVYNTENHKEWKKITEKYKKYFAMNENQSSLDKKLKKANIYAAMHYISTNASKNQVTVVGNGSPCVVGAQIYADDRNKLKKLAHEKNTTIAEIVKSILAK